MVKLAQWLKRDLQLVDRCVTPWVVLAMHRPMYVVYPHKSNRRVGGENLLPLKWLTCPLSIGQCSQQNVVQ